MWGTVDGATEGWKRSWLCQGKEGNGQVSGGVVVMVAEKLSRGQEVDIYSEGIEKEKGMNIVWKHGKLGGRGEHN